MSKTDPDLLALPHTVTKSETAQIKYHYLPMSKALYLALTKHMCKTIGNNIGAPARVNVITERGYAVQYEIEVVD